MSNDLEKSLNEVFQQIGRHFYEENKNNNLENFIYQPLFNRVREIYEEKNKLERKNLAIQGLRRCEACQHIVTIDSFFCNKCGTKLEPLPEDLLKEEPQVKKCSECGMELEEDAVFCPNCGKRL